MTRPELKLSWGVLFTWYLAALALCVCGTFFAYSGPLSSDLWQCWAGPAGRNAWQRDTLRALVSGCLAVYALHLMEIVETRNPVIRNLRMFFPHRPREWLLLVFVTGLLSFLIGYLLPESFQSALLGPEHPECREFVANGIDKFNEIYKPYIPYYVYVFSLWLGMVWPVFLSLVRWIYQDVEYAGREKARLNRGLPTDSSSTDWFDANHFNEIVAAFDAYVDRLREMAERYVPVVLLVILGLLYEQLTPSLKTTTEQATEYGKLVLWFLLGPTLIILIYGIALGYQSASKQVRSGYRAFIDALNRQTNNQDLLDKVRKTRAELIWDRTPASFVLSLFKSAHISVPLLLAIIGYVANVLTKGEWIDLLVPKMIREFVEGLYA